MDHSPAGQTVSSGMLSHEVASEFKSALAPTRFFQRVIFGPIVKPRGVVSREPCDDDQALVLNKNL